MGAAGPSIPIQPVLGPPFYRGHGKQVTFFVDRAAIAVSLCGFQGYRLVADGT